MAAIVSGKLAQSAGVGDTLTCGTNDTVTVRVDAPHVHGGDVAFIWNAARLTSKPLDGSAAQRRAVSV